MGIKVIVGDKGLYQERIEGDSCLHVRVSTFGIASSVNAGVNSVSGKIGDVTLNTDDIIEGNNLFFTQDRVSSNSDVL